MSDRLDLHPASRDEILEAHRNVFDHWNRGRSFDEHMDYRLYSPIHRRATWFVGTVGGRVVVSLATYPFVFRVEGTEMRGSAIGSVFTIPEFRRRGYAAQLVNWVDDHQKRAGFGMSVLYSDIDPAYYAKCGYVLCPSFEGWVQLSEIQPSQTPSQFELVEFDVNDEFDEAATLYAEYHGAAPISLARDNSYWQSILQKFPSDRWFWLRDPEGANAGYARIQKAGKAGRLTDYALANRDDALAELFYAALQRAAKDWDYERVGGWLPDNAATRKLFPVESRSNEITMIKPLGYKKHLSPEAIASTGYFCEIDHV